MRTRNTPRLPGRHPHRRRPAGERARCRQRRRCQQEPVRHRHLHPRREPRRAARQPLERQLRGHRARVHQPGRHERLDREGQQGPVEHAHLRPDREHQPAAVRPRHVAARHEQDDRDRQPRDRLTARERIDDEQPRHLGPLIAAAVARRRWKSKRLPSANRQRLTPILEVVRDGPAHDVAGMRRVTPLDPPAARRVLDERPANPADIDLAIADPGVMRHSQRTELDMTGRGHVTAHVSRARSEQGKPQGVP